MYKRNYMPWNRNGKMRLLGRRQARALLGETALRRNVWDLHLFSSWSDSSFLSVWVKTFQKCRKNLILPLQDEKPSQTWFHYSNENRKKSWNRGVTQGRFPFPLIPPGAGNGQWRIIHRTETRDCPSQDGPSLFSPSPLLLQWQPLSHTLQPIQEWQKHDPA